jgi:hypothetical protein
MTKVVYNACFGGFGLSREACQRYFDIKGQKVWIEDHKPKILGMFDVWLVPPEERVKKKKSMSSEECLEYNKKYSEQTWYYMNVDRHDPVLVQVVEELGDKANGEFAKLRIEEVYGPYRITEYDGNESIETPGGLDWITP